MVSWANSGFGAQEFESTTQSAEREIQRAVFMEKLVAFKLRKK